MDIVSTDVTNTIVTSTGLINRDNEKVRHKVD